MCQFIFTKFYSNVDVSNFAQNSPLDWAYAACPHRNGPAGGMSLDKMRRRKIHNPGKVLAKLRQVDDLVSQGKNLADAVRQIGVTEEAYYRWDARWGPSKRALSFLLSD